MNPELRTIETQDWITIVILLGLLVFVLGKYFYQTRFINFIVLPFNNKYIFLYGKKGKWASSFNIFMSVFQLLNYALFLFLAQQLFFDNVRNNGPMLFLVILGVLVTFHILKITMQLAKAYIFNTKKLVFNIMFNKLSYFNHSSIFVFISNILLVYVFYGSKSVVYITILMVLAINLIGFTNLLKNHQKLILGHLFYFILYLCALEIAPLVILGSYLKD
ncbi:DUF4271 domain-containing protein [Allomuricauda sp. d1]|uniref:DUF4271 domain-containing protein n=1 Tax=Allomuricauda sp. d1 TaxID=3136725 RepID=UPI0031D34F47